MIRHDLDLVDPCAGEFQVLERLGLITEGQSEFSGLGGALEGVQRVPGHRVTGQQQAHSRQRHQQAQRRRRGHHQPTPGLIGNPPPPAGDSHRQHRAVAFVDHGVEFRHHTPAHPIPLARSGTDAGAYLAQRRGDGEFLLQGKVGDIAHATIYSAGESFMLLTVAGSSPGCARRPHRLRALGPCPWEQ